MEMLIGSTKLCLVLYLGHTFTLVHQIMTAQQGTTLPTVPSAVQLASAQIEHMAVAHAFRSLLRSLTSTNAPKPISAAASVATAEALNSRMGEGLTKCAFV